MKRNMVAIVAFTVAAVAGIYFYGQSNTSDDPFGAAFAQEAADIDTSGIQEMSIGNPEAAVTVIEYASFTCPHCARFHEGDFQKLKADFIDTDKINFIYREVYFDRPGLWASIVARCGDNAENRYFGISDILYKSQSDWARQDGAEAIVGSLRKIGKTAGLNDAQLDACLTDTDNAQTLYALWLQRSESDGITSTPSFLINGTKYQNMGYEEMKAIIDEALAG